MRSCGAYTFGGRGPWERQGSLQRAHSAEHSDLCWRRKRERLEPGWVWMYECSSQNPKATYIKTCVNCACVKKARGRFVWAACWPVLACCGVYSKVTLYVFSLTSKCPLSEGDGVWHCPYTARNTDRPFLDVGWSGTASWTVTVCRQPGYVAHVWWQEHWQLLLWGNEKIGFAENSLLECPVPGDHSCAISTG